jgi:isoleucyl-tRNA synthetase
MDYSKTLNLPKTDFAMKANLAGREPERLARWNEMGLYEALMRRESPRGKFILHDGPPYANGDIHMGHALNKTLKDFVVRSRAMMGFHTPYVPGWDCHGMPIENKVREEFRKRHETPTLEGIRRACREYAARWVGVQNAQFQRLGVVGDWSHPYLTMDDHQVAAEIRVFGELAEQGYIYRGLKPVMWCTHDETALAEAEIEYADHVSPSIHVRFPLKTDANGVFSSDAVEIPFERAWTVIWTTTPWTIPANTAVAVSPDADYVIAQTDGDFYLLAEERLKDTMEALGALRYEVVARRRGEELLGLVFKHPLFDRESPLITAPYVTMDTGTGVVHTAPGHGREDFESGVRWNLPIINPVSPDGRFTEEAGPFAEMKLGHGDKAVREALKENGTLLSEAEFQHSYPHCWRCGSPLIFRTTVQWFMNIDHDNLRARALEDVRKVQWVPEESINRISAMVAGRPDWCLSRQRAWGVGIPVFVCEDCDEPLLKAAPINAVADAVAAQGSDIWFTASPEDLLPAGTTCPRCGGARFRKETDILDVWFDSGSTSLTVAAARPELGWPVDVYLEGSDQHRGWFNSSLMVAEGTRRTPPYRTVLTNGWMLDENGRTMSKSKGTGVSPQVIVSKYGADVLRLWVSSTDYTEDARFGQSILDRVADAYRKIRNTLRFLLSNLGDFDPVSDAVAPEAMIEIDRWALQRLDEVLQGALEGYNTYEFARVYRAVYGFCTTDLSAFYLDALKDRLYAEAPDSAARRSAQTVLYAIAKALTLTLAPILVFTADEAWDELRKVDPSLEESVHLALFPQPSGSRDASLMERWADVLALRDEVNKAIEEARNDGRIGKPQEAAVTVPSDWLAAHPGIDIPALREALNVSEVKPGEAIEIGVAEGVRCPRCWLVKKDVGSDETAPEICVRCAGAIAGRSFAD